MFCEVRREVRERDRQTPTSYLLSKLNLPHMFCLTISDWAVMEPLSRPQLLTVRLAVLLLTDRVTVTVTVTGGETHLGDLIS